MLHRYGEADNDPADVLSPQEVAALDAAVSTDHWHANVVAAFGAALSHIDDPAQRTAAEATFSRAIGDAAIRAPHIPESARRAYIAGRVARGVTSAVRAALLTTSEAKKVDHTFTEKLWQGGVLSMTDRNASDDLHARLELDRRSQRADTEAAARDTSNERLSSLDTLMADAKRRGRPISVSQALGHLRAGTTP